MVSPIQNTKSITQGHALVFFKLDNGRYCSQPYNTEKLELHVTWQILVRVSQKKMQNTKTYEFKKQKQCNISSLELTVC